MWLDPKNLPYVALSISIIALLFTILNASLGVLGFVLGRFRLLKVTEVNTVTGVDRLGKFHSVEVDLLSYGASIFDLAVTIEIFVHPNAKTVADRTVGTTSIHLQPVGELPNPLNSGRGVRFSDMWRPDVLDPATGEILRGRS